LSSSNTEAVQTDSLVRHYRLGQSVIRAVDGVSLAVKKGEFAALLGASESDRIHPNELKFTNHGFSMK